MTYYVHATEKMIREALEKLPLVKYPDELIMKGEIKLTFQNRFGNEPLQNDQINKIQYSCFKFGVR